MMTCRGATVACLSCGKTVIPYPVPYGIVWICSCGRWTIIFRFKKKMIQFQIGDEELALEYIAKIGKMLE